MTTALQQTQTKPAPVIGLEEAAALLGMSRLSVQSLRGKDNMARRGTGKASPDRVLFPAADWMVSGNPVWLPATIVAYGKATKRIT